MEVVHPPEHGDSDELLALTAVLACEGLDIVRRAAVLVGLDDEVHGLALVVGLAQVLQERHVALPVARLIPLQELGPLCLVHARVWSQDENNGATRDATGHLLSSHLKHHLRLQRMPVEEDLPDHGIVGGFIIQPFLREAVTPLGCVGGDVPQQEATPIRHLNVLMASQRFHDGRAEGAEAVDLVDLGVLDVELTCTLSLTLSFSLTHSPSQSLTLSLSLSVSPSFKGVRLQPLKLTEGAVPRRRNFRVSGATKPL